LAGVACGSFEGMMMLYKGIRKLTGESAQPLPTSMRHSSVCGLILYLGGGDIAALK